MPLEDLKQLADIYETQIGDKLSDDEAEGRLNTMDLLESVPSFLEWIKIDW